MIKTNKMPTPNPRLLNRPLHKRILAESWTFSASLEQLPGTQHGSRHEYTWTDKKGVKWLDVDSTRYNFIDNGGDILIVAHTDSVVGRTWLKADKHVIASPALDNRIGVWLALCELPRHGIKADILLTEGEETGNSTAQYFKTDKKYNWIAQFDRLGFDCALYQYNSLATREMAMSAGYNPVYGSFTDICYMDHLGVKGFNFGVCYRDYHSDRSHIITAELEDAIQMFLYFYSMYHDLALPHNPPPTGGKGGKYSYYSKYSNWKEGDDWYSYDYTKPVANGPKGGTNWVSATIPASDAPEGQFFKGQDENGYLDDGQTIPDWPSTDTLERWGDIEVYRGGEAYSLEDVSKYGDKAQPKSKGKSKQGAKKMSSWEKWDAYTDAIGTSKEVDTLIPCDLCERVFHPSQLEWHGREDAFMCEDCTAQIFGQQKQALSLQAAFITKDDKPAMCECCREVGTIAECRINGAKTKLCSSCISEIIGLGHQVES